MYIHSLGKLVTVIRRTHRTPTNFCRAIGDSRRTSARQRGSSVCTRGVAPDRRGTGRTGLRRPRPADTGSATRSPSRGSGRSVFARRRSALTHRLHTRRTDTCTPDGHAGPRARLQKSQRKEVRLDTPARTCAGGFRSRVKRCLDHARFVPTCMFV